MLPRPASDPLSELLALLKVRAWVYADPRVCGQWRMDSTAHGAPTYHLVVRGTAWLHIGGQSAPIALRAGDLVVFPRDLPHTLSADATPPDHATLDSGNGGPTTDLVCGQFDLAESAGHMLLDALPPFLLIDGEAVTPGLVGLGRLLASEAEANALGRRLVLDRLSDVLFVAILRHVVATKRVTVGVLAGLADPGIARALAAMTHDPGRSWTISSLAECAGMSRTVFAQQFARLVGEPPISWLTRLRMERGADLLSDRARSVGQVAAQLGYRTEAAFRRAFKRNRGIGPGAHRRRPQSSSAEPPP